MRFIQSLDPGRYAQWRVELENDTKAGLTVIPKTLSEAYSRAFSLKKVSRSAHQPVADASVFTTTTPSRSADRKGGKDMRRDKREPKVETKH